MPATLTLDLIDGHNARKTRDGWEFDRIAIVKDVHGTGVGQSENGHEKAYNAVEDPSLGFPKISDSHPALATCLLREISIIKVTSNEIKYSLLYSERDRSSYSGFVDDSVTVGASLVQTETTIDKDGKKITVTHNGDTQRPFATKMEPQYTLSIQKLKASSPESNAGAYVGKINSVAWRGGDAKTWLCTAITGYSDDGGNTFKVTYEFQFAPGKWRSHQLYIDQTTGRPPDPIDSTGEKDFDIYDEIDFGGLGL